MGFINNGGIMIITFCSSFYKTNTNNTNFRGVPTYQDYAKIIRHGTLKEIQSINWLHGCDKQGRNLLHVAIATMRADVINYLSDKINPNLADRDGVTPLHLAITEGDIDSTKLLINKKANVNKPDVYGDTPLHKAVNNIDIFKYLLDVGANPNVRNIFGLTPLHICYNNLQFLDLLKQHGADFNIKDNAGRTILHYAVEENNNPQIKQFIQDGLNVNATDNYNQTPAFLTKNTDTLELLFRNGANPNIQDIRGNSILHQAAQCKNRELYDFLLKFDANKYLKNAKGMCAYEYIEKKVTPTSNVGFGKVIGMEELKQTLREMVIEPLIEKENNDRYGLSSANGILLHGLPGCGKTFIAKALAEESHRTFYSITPSDLMSAYYGLATQKIKDTFNIARENAPSIVFIDEMESVAPQRTSESSSVAQDNNERIAELLQQMNNLSKDNVFVIGATNKPDMIDDAIKRAGRLDKKVFVPPPDREARIGLFTNMLNKRPIEKDINVDLLALKTENYTAAEIKNIIDFAANIAKKERRNITTNDLLKGQKSIHPAITNAAIEKYKKQVGLSELPEQKKEVADRDQHRGFDKVAGMDDLKEILTRDVISPMKKDWKGKRYGLKPTNGVLLYGPPGTGKTFISEALAEESDRYIVHMRPSSVGSAFQNETALNIKRVFEEAEYNAPSIIFIDEIEALAPKRAGSGGFESNNETNKQVTELLQQINNCADKDIFVIAATNEPQLIDDAIRRVGRFDKTIFVPPPDLNARIALFKNSLEEIYADKNIDIQKLAKMTKNYTAAEIKNIIIRNAAVKAYKMDKPISETDLTEEITKFKPALTDEIIEEYRNKI